MCLCAIEIFCFRRWDEQTLKTNFHATNSPEGALLERKRESLSQPFGLASITYNFSVLAILHGEGDVQKSSRLLELAAKVVRW